MPEDKKTVMLDLTDDELDRRFRASFRNVQYFHKDYYEEIVRRARARHAEAIRGLTIVTTVLAAVATILAVGTFIDGFDLQSALNRCFASLACGGWYRGIVLVLGHLTAWLLVLLAVTGIGFLAVRRCGASLKGDTAGMPVLQPVRIPTKDRSLPGRVVVWLHDVRKWELAENWKYSLRRMARES